MQDPLIAASATKRHIRRWCELSRTAFAIRFALAVAGAGLSLAPRAARADDPVEQADPFWPYDGGLPEHPEAGTRHREVFSYPFGCTCRAEASPGPDGGSGGCLGAAAALLAVLAAAHRRSRGARTPSATREPRLPLA
jgi:hypothetical protein